MLVMTCVMWWSSGVECWCMMWWSDSDLLCCVLVKCLRNVANDVSFFKHNQRALISA